MNTRLKNYWEYLRSSFWFIPALMIITALTMSFNLVSLDRFLNFEALRYYGVVYSTSPDGARTLLSTIAGSVMSVTGVTFSITIVVLNLASSQFGPRIIRNFIRDRSTQAVLGIFVASFLYCILVLRSVQTSEVEVFVPNISIIFAVLLAIVDIGVLIFFIHHIATAIQADTVVSQISKELQVNIKHIFNDELEQVSQNKMGNESEIGKNANSHHYNHPITATCTGYLQAVDYDRLMQIAIENDYLIQLLIRPGQFIVTNATIAIINSQELFDVDLENTIGAAFIIGDQRTSEQDTEYSVHQLVEVAVRALSPGINDPYTAIACIDQLGAALCYLGTRRFPPSHCHDAQGILRLITKPWTYSGLLNASFDQIRQHGKSTVSVVIRLLEVLTIVARQSRNIEQRKAIHRQADMVLRESGESSFEKNDNVDVYERYRLLLSELNEFKDIGESYEPCDQTLDT